MPLGTGLDKFLGKLSLSHKDGDKQRLRQTLAVMSRNYKDVGADVLHMYQQHWEDIHERSVECSVIASQIDVMSSQVFERVRQRDDSIMKLNTLLASLPILEQDVSNVEEDLKKTLKSLSHLEDAIDRQAEVIFDEEIKRKFDSQYVLSIHEKRLNRNFTKDVTLLESKHSKRLNDLKKKEEMKILEKQKHLQEAFEREVKQYKMRGEIVRTSQSSSPVSPPLEEVEVPQDDTDKEMLEKFLEEDAKDAYEPIP